MLHGAAWPAVPTITKAMPSFQQGMKRWKDKDHILHTNQSKAAGKSKPTKPCCSVSGHGWLDSSGLETPSANTSRGSVEEGWAQVSPEQTCAASWAARWCHLGSCRDQSKRLFFQLTPPANNSVRRNRLKLKLSSENGNHRDLELWFELNPSWEVSTRTVPPKHGAGPCLRVGLESTGATHQSTGAAVDHALIYCRQLQIALHSWETSCPDPPTGCDGKRPSKLQRCTERAFSSSSVSPSHIYMLIF